MARYRNVGNFLKSAPLALQWLYVMDTYHAVL